MKKHTLILLLAALCCVACKKNIPNVVDDCRQALADSAANGDVDAQYRLAWQFDAGMDGGTIDHSAAAVLYEQAAAAGNPKAQCMMGYYLLTGEGGLDRDSAQADKLFAACFEPLTQAAEAGDAESQYYVGMMHYMGFKPCSINYDTAFVWFEKAAAAGHAGALEWLANMYYYGYGCQKNPAKTRALLIEAINRGNKKAEAVLYRFSRH